MGTHNQEIYATFKLAFVRECEPCTLFDLAGDQLCFDSIMWYVFHVAVFSKQAGHILIPNDEFFIEPSLDDHREGEYHKHYIYKRESVNSVKNGTNCGTKGNIVTVKNLIFYRAKKS